MYVYVYMQFWGNEYFFLAVAKYIEQERSEKRKTFLSSCD